MDAVILSTLEELRLQLTSIQNDLVLIRFDVEQLRTQLDRVEMLSMPQPEPIGLAPGTPPLDFLPPELM